MKKSIAMLALAAVAGCATAPKPDPAVTTETTYDQIEEARAKKGGYHIPDMKAPRAAQWQADNRAAIDAATTPAELDKLVSSPEAADALCAAVKPGYTGDSLKLTQIAAVSVHVMDKGREAKRRIWVDALERAKKAAPTRDVESFFVQQLMVCGYEKMKTIR